MFHNHPLPPIHPIHPAPPVPPHMGPAGRHNLISVLYDSEKLQRTFGDQWSFPLEKIAIEPPEMKFLFALEMGFQVTADSQVAEMLLRQRFEEPDYKFSSMKPEDITLIAGKLGISENIVSLVLDNTPPGVAAIVIAAARKDSELSA